MKDMIFTLCIVVMISCLVSVMDLAQDKRFLFEESTQESIVNLSGVKPPGFGEDFATLTVGDNDIPICWGISEDGNGFVWQASGYPGFDYPMIIEVTEEVGVCEEVELVTSWGYWYYKFEKSGSAFEEAEALIDKETGNELVNFGRIGEMVVVWSKNSGNYSLYCKDRGTVVQDVES